MNATQRPHEINGDERLTPVDRLRYLAINAWRNLSGTFPRLPARHWVPDAATLAAHTSFAGSPGRVQMDMFIASELPKIIPPGEIRVLDLGCGAGHLRFALAASGYSGTYTGVDISDHRFRSEDNEAFPNPTLLLGDAATIDLGGPYDLVISMSALEHIPDDRTALANAYAALTETGHQIHLVPNGAGLALYLWHGSRQYNARQLAERFPSPRRQVWQLGGLFSFILHVLVVTAFEQILRVNLRKMAPNLYARLNRGATRLDVFCPLGAATTVVMTPKLDD